MYIAPSTLQQGLESFTLASLLAASALHREGLQSSTPVTDGRRAVSAQSRSQETGQSCCTSRHPLDFELSGIRRERRQSTLTIRLDLSYRQLVLLRDMLNRNAGGGGLAYGGLEYDLDEEVCRNWSWDYVVSSTRVSLARKHDSGATNANANFTETSTMGLGSAARVRRRGRGLFCV